MEVTPLMSRAGGWLFTAPDTQETNAQVTANPQMFPGGRDAPGQHPNILHLESMQLSERCTWGRNRGNMNKETHPSGCTKTHERLPVQRTVGLCALVVQEEKQTETQVVRILIFGIVAVEVLVALFLVLLKKLHRHKLKTIFNFKMT